MIDPPPEPFSLQLSRVHLEGGRISFTAEFSNGAAGDWVGQDWLVTAVDSSPWSFPREFEDDGRHKGVQWYAGQLASIEATATHTYEFDPVRGRLAVPNDVGAFVPVASSGKGLGEGTWTLGVRLRHDWYEAAFIPVIKIVVSESGEVSYQAYTGTLGVRLTQ